MYTSHTTPNHQLCRQPKPHTRTLSYRRKHKHFLLSSIMILFFVHILYKQCIHFFIQQRVYAIYSFIGETEYGNELNAILIMDIYLPHLPVDPVCADIQNMIPMLTIGWEFLVPQA